MISILTVCLNSKDELERTIKSVVSQDYCDFEFIIKDGGSKDGTKELVNSYKQEFKTRKIRMEFISCPDKGIADAIMQGVPYCRGNWINLLTAGNIYINNKVLSEIFNNNQYEGISVIYGNSIMRDDFGESIWEGKNITNIKKGTCFNTESAFIEKQSLQKIGYDTDYRIVSDYDFFLKVYESGKRFLHIDKLVVIFTLDGISSTCFVEKAKEDGIVKKRHHLSGGTGSIIYCLKMGEAYIKTLINKCFPQKLKKIFYIIYKKYFKHYKVK